MSKEWTVGLIATVRYKSALGRGLFLLFSRFITSLLIFVGIALPVQSIALNSETKEQTINRLFRWRSQIIATRPVTLPYMPRLIKEADTPAEKLNSEGLNEEIQLDQLDELAHEELVDRLIFQFERKYSDGQNLKVFTEKVLDEMLSVDQQIENSIYADCTEFIANALWLINEDLERDENPLDLIQSYAQLGGVKEPISPEDFVKTRSYRNGSQLEQAEPLSIEEAAESLDSKIFPKTQIIEEF